jgi:low affinity Fe/Cu permease
MDASRRHPRVQSGADCSTWGACKVRLSEHLHRLAELSAHAAVAPTIAIAVAVFLGALTIAGDPASWQTAFATTASAITLVMVFVIQHTQSRQQAAIQLKLDELVRSTPGADDRLVHIEISHEDELKELDDHRSAQHGSLRPETHERRTVRISGEA